MSDIVERLRAKPDTGPTFEVWEIEAPNDAARIGLGETRSVQPACQLNLYHQAADEIERLRDRVSWFEKAGGVAMATKIYQLLAEIVRLRGLLREALDPHLRAAIDWQAGWTDRVRKALGDDR